MANNKRATLVNGYDLQGLYIDGELVAEGLNISEDNFFFILEIAEKYNLKRKDFQEKWLMEVDADLVDGNLKMPPLLADFENDY